MYGILDLNTQNLTDDEAGEPLLASFIAVFTAPLTVNQDIVQSASDTLSLKRLFSASTAQRWTIGAGLFDPNFYTAFDLSFITKNTSGYFYIKMPPVLKPISKAVGKSVGTFENDTDYVNSFGYGVVNEMKTTTSFDVTLSSLARVFVGDYLRFNNHSKIYKIISVVDVPGIVPNKVNIGIYPSIRNANSITRAYFGEHAIMRAYIDLDNIKGLSYSDGILVDTGVIKFVEAL
jgi:hypothetical protein